MSVPNYQVDYEDERFQQVESDKQDALTQVNNTYSDMINQSDQYFNAQIQASKDWADQQQQIQQENTDFAIEKIEQQKEQAEKDYRKEQSAAYVDYQKESNKYGANAEAMAANGLQGTGYSESSKVSMYNTYQNRIAAARESINQATLNYNNAIKEAQIANNSALAEIALQAYQQQLELSLQGFQYKNQLLTEQLAQQQNTEDRYYGRYQDVLAQLNQENALAEQVRQYNESLAEEQRQYNANWQLQQQQLSQEQAQWQKEYELQQAQLAEEQRQFNESKEDATALITKSSHAVNTAYYQGDLNADADKYGTFSNGYQPKGISGYGEVSKTGDTVTFTTATLSGQKQTVTQNVWKTPDGSLWYWDGRHNKYIKTSTAGASGGASGGGGGHSF